MNRLKLALWALVLILFGGIAGPVWLSVLCIVALCFAIPAAIGGMILLPGDPKDRDWTVEMIRTPDEIYRWAWKLLADGESVAKREGNYYADYAEGRADTRIGCLMSAAEDRRVILSKERQKRKAEFGSSTFSLGGRRKTHIHVPAAAETPGKPKESADNQQKSSGLLARYFQAIERLIHRS